MYNFPKLGSFIEQKVNHLSASKKFAREMYSASTSALLLNDKVYFIVPVFYTDVESVFQEPMLVSSVVFEVPRDQSTKCMMHTSHTFVNDMLTHPDYNSGVKVVKGSLNGFLADLRRD